MQMTPFSNKIPLNRGSKNKIAKVYFSQLHITKVSTRQTSLTPEPLNP